MTGKAPGAIQIHQVGKRYSPDSPWAMRDFTLDVSPGELVAIVGASGCGKSTILRMIAGFEGPTEGSITLDEKPVGPPGPDRGFVFQDYGLFPWLTVQENIEFGPRQASEAKSHRKEKVENNLNLVGLTRVRHSYPHQLSGGMQQRVAIARVLANEPTVMLMDEPFGALDALTREQMQRDLAAIRSTVGTTVLFVTHSIEEAVVLADRVIVMTGGMSHGVPGHISSEVIIDLPVQRDPTSEGFIRLERLISESVHAPVGDQVLASP